MSRAQLEKRYGISIVENGYYGWKGYVRLYDIYSADGCCWDKGFRCLRDVEAECKKYADAILSIKEKIFKSL